MVLVGDCLVPQAVALMSMCQPNGNPWYLPAESRDEDMLCMILAIAELAT